MVKEALGASLVSCVYFIWWIDLLGAFRSMFEGDECLCTDLHPSFMFSYVQCLEEYVQKVFCYLNQVCWSRETWKTLKAVCLEDQGWEIFIYRIESIGQFNK